MSDMRKFILDNADRMFKDLLTADVFRLVEKEQWPGEIWSALEENGFTRAQEGQKDEGILDWGDALALLRIAGRHGMPLPLAESLVTSWLLDRVGLEDPGGPLTIAIADETLRVMKVPSGIEISGTVHAVPWARDAARLVIVWPEESGIGTGLIAPSAMQVTYRRNLAGEPRDTVMLDGVVILRDQVRIMKEMRISEVAAKVGLTRVMLMAGALETAFEETVSYAKSRIQFGRPIGQFQAIQQQIAGMAAEVVAGVAAADRALQVVDAAGDEWHVMAMAKIRLNKAVPAVTAVAHQVHGAMGFTDEHPLQRVSRRLFSWRHEYGHDSDLAQSLGDELLRVTSLWDFIVTV